MIAINGGGLENGRRKPKEKEEKDGEKNNMEREEEEALYDKWLPLDDLLEKTISTQEGLKMNAIYKKDRDGM